MREADNRRDRQRQRLPVGCTPCTRRCTARRSNPRLPPRRPDARRTTTRSGPASRPLPRSPGRDARTRRWDTRTIPVARTGDSRIPTWTSSAGTSARRPPNSAAAPGPRPRRTRWRGSPHARRCGRTAGRRRCTPAPCPATSPARPRCCPECGRSRPRGPAGRGTG